MPESALDEVVTWERGEDDVLRVVLQRPPANALGLSLIEGLEAALDQDAGVVVIASRVPGFFAAGADIKHMATVDAAEFSAYGAALRGALNRLADRLAIAAIDGVALGGGLELAMACMLRVATPRSRFGLPEVKLGLIPGAGGTQRLPRLVGRGRALDIMLTARDVGAQEAHESGLVDRLADDAEAAALALARDLRAFSQPALHAVVRSVDRAGDLTLGG